MSGPNILNPRAIFRRVQNGIKALGVPDTRDNRKVLRMIVQGQAPSILATLKSASQSSLLQDAAAAVAGAVSTLAPSSRAVRNFKSGLVQSVKANSRGNAYRVLRGFNLTSKFIRKEYEKCTETAVQMIEGVANVHVPKKEISTLMEASTRKIRSGALVNDKKLQRAIVGICNECVNMTHSH
jgi:hypothetical protein